MKQNKIKEIEVKEIWVPCKHINDDGTVLDFTGLYEVSNLGRVRSLNYKHTGKTKVLRLYAFENKDGSIFHIVCICKDGKIYCKRVHRLVLSSFNQEGWSPNDVVDHIVPRTSTSCNNCLNNLHWTTQKENVNTVHCKELRTNRKDLSKKVKVSFDDGTTEIYLSANEAGRSLGLPYGTVSVMIRKQNGFYKKLNLHFEYIE